jgi:soluble lytic murein transglycosylase
MNATQWQSLSEATFSTAWTKLRFTTKDELLKLMGYFRNTPSLCPYRNAGIAIIAHAESLLPDEAIVGVTEEIYQKTAHCLKPDEEGYERAHLRAGLHRLGRDDEAGAKIALQKAIAATNPKEKYRALFWLGAAELREQEANGKKATTNSYWDTLLKESPLEIHSIIAAKVLDKDPLENLLEAKPLFAARRTSETWTTSNAVAIVTELLLSRKNQTTLNAWFNFLTTVYTTRNPDELLFLGVTATSAEQYLPSIIFLTRYIREIPSIKLNMAFLRIYFPIPFAKEILANTRTVDPVLIFALVRQESAFNPNARSSANARGLMQLLPTTASLFERVSVSSLHDATTNTRIGVKYIESLMKTYQGKAEHVLSAYNAGPQNINRWQVRYSVEQDLLFSDLIPFKETRGYVSSILRNAYWYGRILTSRSDEIGKTTLLKSASADWRSTVVRNLLEVAWNSKAETAQELKNIKAIFRLSKSTDGSKQNEKSKNNVVQEFPSLTDDTPPAARQ